MHAFRLTILFGFFASILLLAAGCGDDDSPAKPATPEPIGQHSVTIENANYASYTGKGFVNLYDGFAYSDQNATDNADKIDFRHQYRGTDIGNRRIFENMTSTGRWDVTDLFVGITPTESQIGPTTLIESEFDAIDNKKDLLESFDFTTGLSASTYIADIDDNILAKVFAFKDKNGKRGLFKVTSADTGPVNTVVRGNVTIEVKVEL